MKTAAFLAVASAAAASAQITYNNQTNTYTCAKPNQAYCAGTSLGTDIIIRCDSTGKGQPGRCTDNLAGEPPLGVQPALCFQTSEISGDAACEKNCVIYGASGNFPSVSTLPAAVCTPYYTASTSSSSVVTTPSGTGHSTKPTQSTTLTTVISGTTTTITTDCSTPVTLPPPAGTGGSGSGSGSGSGPLSNGTITIIPPPTKTPVGPTTTGSSGPTGIATAGAAANRVGGALAAIGLAAVYLL